LFSLDKNYCVLRTKSLFLRFFFIHLTNFIQIKLSSLIKNNINRQLQKSSLTAKKIFPVISLTMKKKDSDLKYLLLNKLVKHFLLLA